jgi:ribosome recycling factor
MRRSIARVLWRARASVAASSSASSSALLPVPSERFSSVLTAGTTECSAAFTRGFSGLAATSASRTRISRTCPAIATQQTRGKKKKAGKEKAAPAPRADEDPDDDDDGSDTAAEFDPAAFEQLMESAIEALERDLGKLRTGRASPGMLENLVVQAYGEHTPLQHLGSVTARNAQTLAVMLYDASLKAAVAAAIRDSPLGFNPREDGDTLVVPVPEMNADVKREVAKMAAKAGETAKVSVRNARKKGMDAIKRAKMPEDEAKRAEKEVQKSHDAFVKRCQDLTVAKEKAIMAA